VLVLAALPGSRTVTVAIGIAPARGRGAGQRHEAKTEKNRAHYDFPEHDYLLGTKAASPAANPPSTNKKPEDGSGTGATVAMA